MQHHDGYIAARIAAQKGVIPATLVPNGTTGDNGTAGRILYQPVLGLSGRIKINWTTFHPVTYSERTRATIIRALGIPSPRLINDSASANCAQSTTLYGTVNTLCARHVLQNMHVYMLRHSTILRFVEHKEA